jgi:hypothetical protein
MAREEELVGMYTVGELATLLARAEREKKLLKKRVAVMHKGLVDIRTGHWTAEGARIQADKWLGDALRLNMGDVS